MMVNNKQLNLTNTTPKRNNSVNKTYTKSFFVAPETINK